MKDLLVVVDKDDQILGYKTQEECHKGKGVLHRAFSVFIFNSQKELLLQKRSSQKQLWPLVWSNTCCSHQKKDQAVRKESVEKRLKEELGFTCPLKFLDKLIYQASYRKVGSENEITYIFVGKFDDKIKPNKKEVMEVKWMDLEKLRQELKTNPSIYTPWLRLIVEKLKNRLMSHA